MKLSPLQLLEYFVAEFHYSVNSRYDAKKDLELKPDELTTETTCNPGKSNPRLWTVTIDVKYQPAAETNTPYVFSLSLVGFFEVAKAFDETRVALLVKTNGASVLYGTAREIIREQTSRGPAGPFLLPTTSFVPDDPPATPAAEAGATPTVAQPAPGAGAHTPPGP
jgi:preprotein translocase subunit SecB